ncbi:MAG: sugar kinase [Enterococcaceae bacterium]|jgi:2-dehydro-3-deoxygluconokinase|nr:sugar kinase [Enterococcaceae bacterium]MCI1919460.1 sugar kinase [Enterococcaceae bacterium]
MGKVLTIGEPLGLFSAQTPGKLKNVEMFKRSIAGEVSVAVGLARMGHGSAFVSAVGNDPLGEHIVDFFQHEGVDTSMIRRDKRHATGFQMKGLSEERDPEVVYFRQDSAAASLGPDFAENIDFSGIDIFHLTGIFMALTEDTFELTERLVQKAKEQGTLIVFDPNLRPVLWQDETLMIERINRIARQADFVLPGVSEGRILTGSQDIEVIADFYLAHDPRGVVIKTGPKGAFMKYVDDDTVRLIRGDGFPLDTVVDTTGAGDGFTVGFLSALLEDLTYEKMLERGNAIGAMQVSHPSAIDDLPTPEELAEFLAAYQS